MADERQREAILNWIRQTAAKHGLPADVFERQLQQESGLNPNAVSPVGAQGIAQFMPGTAKDLGLTDPFNPEASIDKAGQYLASLQKQFGGDMSWALAAYNAGPGNVKKWQGQGLTPENIPFPETKNYVQKILNQVTQPEGNASSEAGIPWLNELQTEDDTQGIPWMQELETGPPEIPQEGLGSKIWGGIEQGVHALGAPGRAINEGFGDVLHSLGSPMDSSFTEQAQAAFVPPPNQEVTGLDIGVGMPGALGVLGKVSPKAQEYASAVANPVVGLGAQLLTDPLSFGPLGVLNKFGKAGKALHTALSAAFAGTMGKGGLEAGKAAWDNLQAEGLTPETIQRAVESLTSLGFAGLAAKGAVGGAKEMAPPPVRTEVPRTQEVLPPPPVEPLPSLQGDVPPPSLEALPPPPRLAPIIPKRGRSGRMEKPDFVPEKLPEVWGEEPAPRLQEEVVQEGPDFGVHMAPQDARWHRGGEPPKEKVKQRLTPLSEATDSLTKSIKDSYRKYFIDRMGTEIRDKEGRVVYPSQANPEHQAAIDASEVDRFVFDREGPVASARSFPWMKKTSSPTESFPAHIDVNLAKLPDYLDQVVSKIRASSEIGIKDPSHFAKINEHPTDVGTYRHDVDSAWEWWRDDFAQGKDGRWRLREDRSDPEYLAVKAYQGLLAHEIGHAQWAQASTLAHGPKTKFDPMASPAKIQEAILKGKGTKAGEFEEFIKGVMEDLSEAPKMAQLHKPEIYKAVFKELRKAEAAFATKESLAYAKAQGFEPPEGFQEGGVLPPPPVKPKPRTLSEKALEVINIPRATATAGDFSMVLRQSIIGTARHPLRAMKMLPETFKVFKSKKAYDEQLQQMSLDPDFEFMTSSAKKSGAGLAFSDIANKPEEAYYGSRLIRETFAKYGKAHLDPIFASERAFTYFLNKMRFDMMKDAMRDMEALGIKTRTSRQVPTKKGIKTVVSASPAAREMAEWINVATGHGNIPKKGVTGHILQGSHNLLNTVFFSPRLVWSRGEALNMALNPLKWHTVMKNIAKDAPSKRAAMSLMIKHQGMDLAATAGLIGLMTSTAAATLGGEVEKDPRSSDFLQVRKGTTRVDMTGGFRPYLNLGARLISGMTKPQFSEAREQARLDTIAQFGRSRFSPVMTTMHDMLGGTNFRGQDYWGPWKDVYEGNAEITPEMAKELGKVAAERVGDAAMPMLIRDLTQAMDEDPVTAAMMAIPAFLGASLNTHERPKGIDEGLYEVLREAQINPFGKTRSAKIPKVKNIEGGDVRAPLPWLDQKRIKEELEQPFYERVSEMSKTENFRKLSPLAKHLILKMLFVEFAGMKTKVGAAFVPPPLLKKSIEDAKKISPELEEDNWLSQKEWLPVN